MATIFECHIIAKKKQEKKRKKKQIKKIFKQGTPSSL